MMCCVVVSLCRCVSFWLWLCCCVFLVCVSVLCVVCVLCACSCVAFAFMRLVATLTCKSFVTLGFWAKDQSNNQAVCFPQDG